MNITFACPKCARLNRSEIQSDTRQLVCAGCGSFIETMPGAISERVERCAVCPSHELYVRKDFSQRLGAAIVVVGLALSSLAWAWRWPLWTYAILFATALIDLALYFVTGNVLQCYHCKAEYRGVPGLDDYEPFNLEVHERHRQQAARLAETKSET